MTELPSTAECDAYWRSRQIELSLRRRRWFVERQNFGQHWVILPAYETAEEDKLYLCSIELARAYLNPETINAPVSAKMPLAGCYAHTTIFDRGSVQELMDALWEAGMRPSRR